MAAAGFASRVMQTLSGSRLENAGPASLFHSDDLLVPPSHLALEHTVDVLERKITDLKVSTYFFSQRFQPRLTCASVRRLVSN